MKNIQDKKQKNLIKNGEIFRLGSHILGCGSSLDNDFVNKVIGENKIKAIITDPPYGISYVENKKGFADVKVDRIIENDNISTDKEYVEFTKKYIEPVLSKLEDKNLIYVFNSDKMLFALKQAFDELKIKTAQLLIWVKNHSTITRNDWLPMHELILYGWFGKHEFIGSKDKTVLYYPKPNSSSLHPTMKPIGLLRKIILNSTRINDIVYDCFGGSGSTIIASEHTKRRCISIEKDPHYCEVIIKRWEKLTNLKAEKL